MYVCKNQDPTVFHSQAKQAINIDNSTFRLLCNYCAFDIINQYYFPPSRISSPTGKILNLSDLKTSSSTLITSQ